MTRRACESCWFASYRRHMGREILWCLVQQLVVAGDDDCEAWMLERPHGPAPLDVRQAAAVLP